MVQPTKIMIVDDNPIDHMITKYILKHNFSIENVTVMECAEDALSYLVERQNNITDLPELIILDLDMPCINGFGFLERFAKLNEQLIRKCKIVVLTGSDVLVDLAKIKANPYVTELISKPLNKTSLSELI
jgi:CheY-like chemotaxis protein